METNDLVQLEIRQSEIKAHRRAMAAKEAEEYNFLLAFPQKPKSLFTRIQGIFNPAVPMASRARFLDMSHWNTLKNPDALFSQVDGVVLKCGGMDISDGKGALKVYEDVNWSANVQIAYDHKKRIEAYFYAHPDYHLLKQRSLDWVKNQDYKTNEILIQLITSLHNGPWTWDTLVADRGWKPIEALWIDLEETDAWNGKITPAWQEATIFNILEPLRRLQLQKKIPDWKLGVYTRPLFIRDDCKNADGSNPLETYLWNRRDWIYLWLAQWIFALDPDIQLNSLGELWQKYLPPDTFKFLYVPYQLENRIWHHQFTGEKFDTPEYTPEVDANLHFDTVEAYDRATGFVSGSTPPPPPVPEPTPEPTPVDLTEVLARLTEVDTQLNTLESKIDDLATKLNKVLRLE